VLDFAATDERLEENSLINDIRQEVERWRASNDAHSSQAAIRAADWRRSACLASRRPA
jgi:hypothetical protein